MDGPTNMAADDAILQTAEARGISTVRLYQWAEPTLSLGYFQGIDERLSHSPSRSCPVVRRKSGGGAILHHHEITYACAFAIESKDVKEHEPSSERKSLSEWLYDKVHSAWLRALAACQLSPHRFGPGCAPSTTPQPFLCFQRRSCWDLLIGDHKILGSAQRKGRRAILQHGSLLLAQSQHAPELLGLAEMTPNSLPPKALVDRFLGELAAGLSLQYQPTGWDRSEIAEIQFRDQQRTNLYGNPDWTLRR